MTRTFLPYGRQSIDEDDIAAVAAALRKDYLTTGPMVVRFEEALCDWTRAPQAVACSNGTAALHLAVRALGLGPGSRIIVPAITFLASANVGRFEGADIVFADVDPDTGLMRPDDLQGAIERADGRIDAVVTVPIGGQYEDRRALHALAKAHGAAVIDDACHALGGVFYENPDDPSAETGVPGDCRHADLSTFSFHPVKAIALGEGGAVTVARGDLAAHMRRDRTHGMERDLSAMQEREAACDAAGRLLPWWYEMAEIGYNYRLSDIACALGLSQLTKLERFRARRRALVARYRERLSACAPLVQPVRRVGDCDPNWHLMVVLIDFAAACVERADLMNRLKEDGIGTQVHYIPVDRQPYYRALYGAPQTPGAERYYERCLSLPLFAEMTETDVDFVVDCLATHLGADA